MTNDNYCQMEMLLANAREYQKLGDKSKEKQALEKALSINPNHRKSLYNMAFAYYKEDKESSYYYAKRYFSNLDKLDLNDATLVKITIVYIKSCLFLYKNIKDSLYLYEAIEKCEELIEHEHNYLVHEKLIKLYTLTANIYKSIIEHSPKEEYAKCYNRFNNLCDKILDAEPNNAHIYICKGIVEKSLENSYSAIEYFNKAKYLENENRPEPFIHLGYIYKNMNKYDWALDCYQKANKLTNDNDAEILYQIVSCYYFNNQLKEASLYSEKLDYLLNKDDIEFPKKIAFQKLKSKMNYK